MTKAIKDRPTEKLKDIRIKVMTPDGVQSFVLKANKNEYKLFNRFSNEQKKILIESMLVQQNIGGDSNDY